MDDSLMSYSLAVTKTAGEYGRKIKLKNLKYGWKRRI